MRAVVVVLLGWSLSGVARAGDDPAKAAFTEGRRLFELHEYDRALEAFKRAYLTPGAQLDEAAFIFNIAQCHNRLGHLSDAVELYERYLEKKPDAEDRAEVERTIAELRRAPVVKPIVAPAEPLRLPPPVEKKPIYRRWWLWTAAAGVLAVAGITLTLVLVSRNFSPTLPEWRLPPSGATVAF